MENSKEPDHAYSLIKENTQPIWTHYAMGTRGGSQMTSALLNRRMRDPHVRWCGRVTGRNPRDSIRFYELKIKNVRYRKK